MIFRVRERDSITFALSLSFRNQTKHYKIEKHRTANGEKLAIEDGPRFDSLMDVRYSSEKSMNQSLKAINLFNYSRW